MRSFILLIAFCAVASFAVAQKSEKDRKAGLKPLKQKEANNEARADEEREMRKIASGRGEEELEEEIERSLEGLDEEIERNLEIELEGLDEQIEMSIEESMRGLDEALEALDHLDLDIDIRVNNEMINVDEIVKEAIRDAKVDVKVKTKPRPQQ